METWLAHINRDLHLMFVKVGRADLQTQWTAKGVLVFSVVFFVVGLFRVVEFEGLGLSLGRKRALMTFHVLGCLALAIMLALLGFDIDKSHASVISGFLVSALTLLFPTHIYAGLLRRIELRKLEKSA